MVSPVALTSDEVKWVEARQSTIEDLWGEGAVVTLRQRLLAGDKAELSLHVLAAKQPGWDSKAIEFELGSADELALPALRESLFRDLSLELGEAEGDFRWQ